MDDDGRTTRLHLAILLAGCLLTIVPNIASRDLWEPEELRYAEISREMAERGEWALLTLNYIPYADKPPLFFWMICASAKCFGGFHAAAVRVPNIASGVLLVVLVYLFGRVLIGRRAAFLACLALMATPFFVWTCAEARMDTTLTVFITLALWCFWRNYEGGGRSLLLHVAFGVFAGLAVMTKGPIGFCIPFLAALAFAAYERQARRLLNVRFLAAVVAVLAVVLPWLVTACVRGGREFSEDILLTQNAGRMLYGIRHSKPFYHFIKVIPGILVPWTLFLPAMLCRPIFEADRQRKRGLVFALCWFLTVFVFFSFVKGKRTIYMMPLLPAAGMLLGAVLDRFLSAEQSDRPARGTRWVLGITEVVLLFACGLVPLFIQLFPILANLYPAIQKAAGPGFDRSADYLFRITVVASAATIGAVVGVGLFIRGQRARSLYALIGAVSLSWFLASVLILPAVNNEKSARIMLNRLARTIDREHASLRIFSSERLGYAVYWGRPIPVVEEVEDLDEFLKSPERVYCLAREDQFPEDLLFFGKEGYVVWRDSCGYRQHILVSNQIAHVPIPVLKRFQHEYPDACALETREFTVLASSGRPTPEENADFEVAGKSRTLILRFYPAKCDPTASVRFRLRGVQADSATVRAQTLGASPSPAECRVAPHSSPFTASVSLREPCEVVVEHRAAEKP